MQNNAIKFNLYQKQIMQDQAFLLAKREIIKGMEEIFAQLQQEISAEKPYIHALENALDLKFQHPKITKGDNYKGLPYVVLDDPRYFSGHNIFTFRSMFWWGNFYSFSLFVSGEAFEKLKHFLDTAYMAADTELYIGVGDKLWEYDFLPDNYFPVKALSESNLRDVMLKDFLKLSYKFPIYLTEDEIIVSGKECFLRFARFLKLF
jgi:hypothetical protein